MLEVKEIRSTFKNLKNFEEFSQKWIRACAKINEKGKNAELLSIMDEADSGYLECIWE